MNIVLASKSPRRRELLSLLGLKFEIIDTHTDESCDFSPSPAELVQGLALRKASAAKKLCTPDTLIIAADTVVCIDECILGKPHTRDEAYEMIRSLSDAYHQVHTGYAITLGDKLILDHCTTEVKMRYISPEEIEQYISTPEPYDKAGGYGIQERGGIFVERINGNYHNVVGLPICDVAKHLTNDFGITIG